MAAAQPFSLLPPLSVPPNAVERGLTALWKRADQELRGGTQQVLVRACTLNLAVVLPRPDLLSEAAEAAAALNVRHPSRTFLLTAEVQAAGVPLETTVSAWCHLPTAGAPPVCCEQVTVMARGEGVRGLRSLLLGLLVPDVPLVMWWRHGLSLDLPLFEELASAADRLILDTAEFSVPAAALRQLAQRSGERSLALTDLAWNRLTCWRELTAQFFDAPDPRQQLNRLDHIRLDVGGGELRPEGLLWLGWIGSRLGWTVTAAQRSERGYLCRFASGSGEVQAEIHTNDAGGSVIQRIELAAGATARFVLDHQCGCVRAAAELPAAVAPPRAVQLHEGEILQML